MTKFNTPLQCKLLLLPKFVDFELDIRPELHKAGITRNQFKLDCDQDPVLIPPDRLLVYAQIFNCSIKDLTTLSNFHGHH